MVLEPEAAAYKFTVEIPLPIDAVRARVLAVVADPAASSLPIVKERCEGMYCRLVCLFVVLLHITRYTSVGYSSTLLQYT